jgi:C4-dicarboxylate-binding protein DctP
MWTQDREPIRRFFLFAFSILCLTCNCLLSAGPVQAQQQTVRVLIDASFRTSGQRFMEQLSQNLAGQARENVHLQWAFFPPSEIEAHLQDLPWDLAILSTSTLLDTKIKSTAVAFEMPFVFPNMTAVRNLQHSSIGRAALSTMSDQGITGLVYLNAGLTLLANRNELTSPNDKGIRVAVFSPAQEELFKKIGTQPLLSQFAEARAAVNQGSVDSVAINSANSTSWVFPSRGSLLTDSVKAQVAVVVTQDKSWNSIPFVYRAIISDAAIAVSQRIDQSLIEAERPLLEKARSAGVSLVSFSSDEASRATHQWISEQPESLRGIFISVYDYVKSVGPLLGE